MSYSGRSKQNRQFPTSSHLNKHRFFFQGHTRVLQNLISQIKTFRQVIEIVYMKKKSEELHSR